MNNFFLFFLSQEAGIIKYVRGQAGPSAKPLKDQEAFDKFSSNEDEVGVVAFVEKDSAEEKQFIDVATKVNQILIFSILFCVKIMEIRE